MSVIVKTLSFDGTKTTCQAPGIKKEWKKYQKLVV